jgi:hypothetical protein
VYQHDAPCEASIKKALDVQANAQNKLLFHPISINPKSIEATMVAVIKGLIPNVDFV